MLNAWPKKRLYELIFVFSTSSYRISHQFDYASAIPVAGLPNRELRIACRERIAYPYKNKEVDEAEDGGEEGAEDEEEGKTRVRDNSDNDIDNG